MMSGYYRSLFRILPSIRRFPDEILYLLGTMRYSSVEFVVYIAKLIDKQVDVCVLLDSQSKNKNYIEWYMNNVFLLNWASFNKYAIKM